MDYSYQEKISMMRILMDIIHADGIIDSRETFFFNQLKGVFNLDECDHDNIKKKNSLLALVHIKRMDRDKQLFFVDLMGKMIVVDEDINVNELAIFNVVCEFCNIKQSFEDTIGSDAIDLYSKS